MAEEEGGTKYNRRGWKRNYKARRAVMLGGSAAAALVSIFLIISLIHGGGGGRGGAGGGGGISSNQQQVSTIFAGAVEVEVTADGRTVQDPPDAEGLKGTQQDTPPQQRSAESEEEITKEEEVPAEVHNEQPSKLLLKTFPQIKYGTAWKKDATAGHVYNAIHAGFRHIDTACQPRHYNEKGVGEGWTSAAKDLGLSREDIWLQTKFTSVDGQDPKRIPYDEDAPLDDQVRQSLAKSLENLQTDYIDSLVLHGPENSWEANLLIWSVFESFVDDGKVGQIGISNFYDPDAVSYLYSKARIKPAVVQNRFYADSDYDTKIRAFCQKHNIEYQSFWTLGANRHVFENDRIRSFASEKGLTPQTLMYAFVMAIGITPLDGTTSKEHMAEDIALLRRVRDTGEKIFGNHEELTMFAEILGIPDWE